jgi:excisionase family DNA binding protein
MIGACEQIKSDTPYITPKELAAALRVSEKTIYRYAAQDATMPVLRIGGVVRFPRARLERWLHEREQGRGRTHRIEHQMLSSSKPAPA